MSSRKEIMEKIAEIAKAKSLVSMRDDIEAIEGVEKVDFTFEPVPHFRISISTGNDILVVNEKHADPGSDDIAAGGLVIGA